MVDSLSPREVDRATDREQVLRQIDVFLRTASVPDKLARFLAPQPPDNIADSSAPHHPDAPELLRRAQERQPAAERFALDTLRAALRGLLYDRWTMAVMLRLSRQPPAVADGVLKRLTCFAPRRCADDVWWVWCRLAKKFPDEETFDYSERQIRGAWREVLAERRHWDTAGGGPQGSPASKARRAALRRMAAESHRPLRELARLQMADYDPLSAEVRLSPASHGSIVLSRCGRKSMEFWLAIRGGAEGRLFEAPTKPAATAARGGSSAHELDECPDRHVVDGGRRLEEADLIERIAGEDDAAALIYLRENVTSQGDWPEGLLQSLDARSVALSPPTERSASQKKRQRRLGRVHCIERWRELSQ